MPFGNDDWLALTPEPTVEPELPICDPHHHFWDFRTDRMPYQRYLLHELMADLNSGHNVRSWRPWKRLWNAFGPNCKRDEGALFLVVDRSKWEYTIRPRLPGDTPQSMKPIPNPC
jgi:hypothetical protein